MIEEHEPIEKEVAVPVKKSRKKKKKLVEPVDSENTQKSVIT